MWIFIGLLSVCRLDDEKKACKELEKDLEDVNKTAEATKLKSEQTKKEIDLVNEELARLQQEHKDVRPETNTYKNTQDQLIALCEI